MNLLLLTQDEAWRSAAIDHSGWSTPVALALSADDAVVQMLRAPDPFTHVLVEPLAAGASLAEIAGVVARQAHRTTLVLLGAETEDSRALPAVRAPAAADLIRLIGAGKPAAPALSPAELQAAFTAGQLVCAFQPIVRLADGAPAGIEALARVHHPKFGVLQPDSFVPVAETAGLSLELTDAVLRAALGVVDGAFLQRHGLFMTVNLPLDVLLHPPALALLERHRAAAGMEVGHILIELTESRPVFDIPRLMEALRRWRAIGYHLAIDDLGPEMVNQAQLFELPFDMVKLDKGVVLRSRTNLLAQRYLQRTIASAKARSLAVIAEGIEDTGLWVRMRDAGVEYGQGFLIARPLPGAELDAWFAEWAARDGPPGG